MKFAHVFDMRVFDTTFGMDLFRTEIESFDHSNGCGRVV